MWDTRRLGIKRGYPTKDFLKALDVRLEKLVEESRGSDACRAQKREINRCGAALSGLSEGTSVAVSVIDAHAAVLGSGYYKTGEAFYDRGDIHVPPIAREKKACAGISGVVEDGIIPGYFGYEAGKLVWETTLLGLRKMRVLLI